MKSISMVLAAMFLLALSASADQVQLTYNGYPYGVNDGQFYVGNAGGTLDGKSITMWCVDPAHEIQGNTWMVNVYPLAKPSALDGTLGLLGTDFQAMFLLGRQFTNTSADVGLQHAIWSFADGRTLTSGELALKNAALGAIGNYNFDKAYALVGVPNRSGYAGQMMEYGEASPVPEPSSVVLLGSGLFVSGLVLRRRVRKC